MSVTDLKYHDVTEQIIGCAMRVHAYFGPGFPEVVYKRALMIEFEKLNISYQSEIDREIFYERKLIAKRRLDLIVENKVLTELKAVSELDNRCLAQIINYLRVFDIEVGLLLNFGEKSLRFKRFINNKESVKSFLNPPNP